MWGVPPSRPGLTPAGVCILSGMPKTRRTLEVGGYEVSISNPDKVYFPKAGYTKLDLVDYYLKVAEGALRGAGGRPNVLKRYVDGVEGAFFFQKRAPKSRPAWLETVALRFPSGRSAEEVVPRQAAALAWMVNLGCIDLNPHPVRAEDLDHPDELRVDLDPTPGVPWSQIVEVAFLVRAALDELGLVGWPKTSGSRGVHINVRLRPAYTFDEVRRAALALAREVERRAPELATSAWWKEERHGVFLDYNQNAKDRTVASAYSVRPTGDARVSAPVTWDELGACDPRDFTLKTMPIRFAQLGDRHADIDRHPCGIDALLALAAEQEAAGLDDGPPARSKPSRADKAGGRRVPKYPLITVAKAANKAEALAGLERWKARFPQAAAHLVPADVLVDAMRGRYTTWTRVRINLQHVPATERPAEGPPDPDYDPFAPKK